MAAVNISMMTYSPEGLGVTDLSGLPPFPLGGSKILNSAVSTGNQTNLTTDELMLKILGPQRKDVTSCALLTLVYCLVFLSGFVGNICTCVVIARNHYMQTTTNYYLFNLAVSDLMLIVFGLPPELYTIWEAYPWRFGEIFCIFRHTVMEMTSYASVLTITAFTVERYIAICRPLLAHKMTSLSRSVKIIIAVWLVAVLAALPYALHTRQFYAMADPATQLPVPDSLICNIPEKWRQQPMRYIFQMSTFVFFLTPVTIIICLYILIGLALRRSDLTRAMSEESHYGSRKKEKSKANSTKTVPKQPRRVVMRILGVLYFISSTCNPILYNVISKRYRLAFKETLCCCLKSKPLHSRDRFSPEKDRHSRATTEGAAHRIQRNGSGSHVSFSNKHQRRKTSSNKDGEFQRVRLLDSPVTTVARKPILRNNSSLDSQTCDTPLLNEASHDSHVVHNALNGSVAHHTCLDSMERSPSNGHAQTDESRTGVKCVYVTATKV